MRFRSYEDGVVSVALPRLKPSYSETFIAQHIARLPGPVKTFYTPWFLNSVLLGRRRIEEWLDKPYFAQYVFRRGLMPLFRVCEGLYTEALIRHIKKWNVGVLLAEFGPVGVSALAACTQTGTPLVVHFHGFDAYQETVLKLYRRHYQKLFKKAFALISVSHDMTEQLVRLGASREKILYNPYGVEETQFESVKPERNPPIFLAVGRFVSKKSPDITLRAFKGLLNICPDARLVMVGDGPLWVSCKKMADGLGISRRVVFTGKLPHQDVLHWLAQARAFVQHSVTAKSGDAEGTPVAVIEAQMSGLPVVATRHKGIEDLVINLVTGYLVEEGQVQEMTSRMAILALHPLRAALMGAAGRRRALEHYSASSRMTALAALLTRAQEQKVPIAA